MQAAPALPAENDCVLVICGDTPLLRPQTIAQLIARHEAEGNAVTLLTAHAENPTGYGRIVRQGEQIAQSPGPPARRYDPIQQFYAVPLHDLSNPAPTAP